MIHFNTILLILVATAGFLGSMIHIASSFTNYIGSEKFKNSWLLWYVVKPFTGSALALVVYFVFRAGLLNFNDPTNINLFGIVTLSAFAGLFADDAALKLKEIFDVVFKPKDPRPDKIEEPQIKFLSIQPDKLATDLENTITITGENFDKKKMIVKINDLEVKTTTITANLIIIKYKIPEDQKSKTEFKLVLSDEKGNQLYTPDKPFTI